MIMPFWTRKPSTNEQWIAQEREKMEKRRREFLAAYYRKKAEQQSEPEPDKTGPTRKERFISGAKKLGRGLKKAYEYEPSEKTKKSVRAAGRGVRRELAELDTLAPRRRYPRRSNDDEGDMGDYFDMNSISGYAGSFDPWQNSRVRSGHSEQFTNEYEGYADQFDPFKKPKGRKSSSIGFDNPLQGYIDAFDPWAPSKRRR